MYVYRGMYMVKRLVPCQFRRGALETRRKSPVGGSKWRIRFPSKLTVREYQTTLTRDPERAKLPPSQISKVPRGPPRAAIAFTDPSVSRFVVAASSCSRPVFPSNFVRTPSIFSFSLLFPSLSTLFLRWNGLINVSREAKSGGVSS